jgi:predicted nucleic acid-binding protein
MPDRRRIVPDNSVMVEALIGKSGGNVSARSQQFLAALFKRTIVCFAPDTLMVEFVKVAFEFRSGRRSHSLDANEIDSQLESFLRMDIVYLPSSELVVTALHHCRSHDISALDSWYLAAAEVCDAELWISHDHADGFTANARGIYPKVYTLQRNNFHRSIQ